MAERIARLGIEVNSAQVRKANSDLNKLQKSSARTTRGIKGLASAAIALTAALTTNVAIRLADRYTEVTNKLKQATNSSKALAQAQADVIRISNSSLNSLEATATLYGRIGRASAELGITQAEVATVTETISKAIKVSGASAQEAEGAIRQLAQGLASGTLRGEEFNAVAENAPRLLEIFKTELKLTQGELRAMAAQGKLTADIVIQAILKQTDTIEKEFKSFAPTVRDALTVVSNGFTVFVGELDKSTGASKALSQALVDIGNAAAAAADSLAFNRTSAGQLNKAQVALNQVLAGRNELQRQANKLTKEGRIDLAQPLLNEIKLSNRVIETRQTAVINLKFLIAEEERFARALQVTADIKKQVTVVEDKESENKVKLAADVALLALEYEKLGGARTGMLDVLLTGEDELAEISKRNVAERLARETRANADIIDGYILYGQTRNESVSVETADLAILALEYEKLGGMRLSIIGQITEANKEATNEELLAIAQRQDAYSGLFSSISGLVLASAQNKAASDLQALRSTQGLSEEEVAAREAAARKSFESSKNLNKSIIALNTGAAIMQALKDPVDPITRAANAIAAAAIGATQFAMASSMQFGGSAPSSGANIPINSNTTNNQSTNFFNITATGGNAQDILGVVQRFLDSDGILIEPGSAQGQVLNG